MADAAAPAMLETGWVRIPSLVNLSPVLVAIGDAPLRVDLAAALVARGLRILIARTGAQLTKLVPSASVVIVDGAMLAGLAPGARRALARVTLVPIFDHDEIAAVVAAALDAA
jgi:hypothetical protein